MCVCVHFNCRLWKSGQYTSRLVSNKLVVNLCKYFGFFLARFYDLLKSFSLSIVKTSDTIDDRVYFCGLVLFVRRCSYFGTFQIYLLKVWVVYLFKSLNLLLWPASGWVKVYQRVSNWWGAKETWIAVNITCLCMCCSIWRRKEWMFIYFALLAERTQALLCLCVYFWWWFAKFLCWLAFKGKSKPWTIFSLETLAICAYICTYN